MQNTTARRNPLGAVLMIVGGALSIAGSFLPWAKASVQSISATANGMDGDGELTLILGIALAVFGVISLTRSVRPVTILGIVAGVLIAAIGLYDASTVKDDIPAEAIAGGLKVTVEFGLWIVIAAGVIGTIGGVLALMAGKREEMAGAPAMPGGFGASDGMATPSSAAPPVSSPPSDGPPSAPAPPATSPPPPPLEPGS